MKGCAPCSGPAACPAPSTPQPHSRCSSCSSPWRPTRTPRRPRPSTPRAAWSRSTSPAPRPARRCASSTPTGDEVATQPAGELGGAVFREVRPGSGYRVTQGDRVVAAADGALHALGPARPERLRPDDPRPRLRLPDDPRRDAARHQRPAPVRRGALPDARRVLGLRLRAALGRPELDRADRAAARLRRGRRQHARHRLLGRRVRLLRAAAGPRRLRRHRDRRAPAVGRGPPRRHDGDLLRRHQPALRGPHEPAEPGRHHAAVGHRRHGDDALSRRHPQHGLRAVVGQGPRARRAAGVPDRRPAVGARAHQRRRHDLPRQPGPAHRGASTSCARPTRTASTCRGWPTRWRRSPSSTRSRRRSSWPASSPTSRPAATAPRWPAGSPARGASGSRSRTARTSTRWTRRRSTAGTTSSSSTSPTARPTCPPALKALATAIYSTAMGIQGVTLPDDPLQGQRDLRRGAGRLRGPAARADPVRQRRRRHRPGTPVAGFERSFARFPLPGTTPRSWYLGSGGTLERKKAQGTGADRFTWDPAARPPTSFTGNTGSGAGGLWTVTPQYHWQQPPAGNALAYVTPPLDRTTTVVGAGAVEAWIKASVPNVDLQVTVSEVRPDGKETFVQNGWLRTSGRKLDSRKSTLLEPGAEPARGRRPAAAGGPLREDLRAALLPGARLPRGLADPPADLGARRRPARLVVLAPVARGPTPVSLAYSREDALAPRAAHRARASTSRRRCRRARRCAASRAGPTSRWPTRRPAAERLGGQAGSSRAESAMRRKTERNRGAERPATAAKWRSMPRA